jgi:hypothetical protein
MFETALRNEPSVPPSEALKRHCHHPASALMFTGGQSHDGKCL